MRGSQGESLTSWLNELLLRTDELGLFVGGEPRHDITKSCLPS